MNTPETAIQAAAETFAYATGNDWRQVSAPDQEIYLQEARAALEAALPHTRAMIAAEIRAHYIPANNPHDEGFQYGLEYAARIVEGTTK